MKHSFISIMILLCPMQMTAQSFYIGSTDRSSAGGIHLAEFNAQKKQAVVCRQVSALQGPSFYVQSKDGRYLYTFGRMGEGKLLIYQFGIDQNGLTPIDSVETVARELCHISLTEAEDAVLVASYADGLIEAFPLDKRNKMARRSILQRHTDYLSQHPFKGRTPHAHQIRQYNGAIYVADLGLDALFVYRLHHDRFERIATLHEVEGAGPRHVDFSPDGKSMALINELGSTVSMFRQDADGIFSQRIQTLTTLPAGFEDKNQCADIHFSPCGRWLYGSNRGHNSLIRFAVNADTGELSDPQWTDRVLDWPRNFGLTKDGTFVIVGNERGNSLTVFSINPQNGTLTECGKTPQIAAPSCMVF